MKKTTEQPNRDMLAARMYGPHWQAQQHVNGDSILANALTLAIGNGLDPISLDDVPLYRRSQHIEDQIAAFNAMRDGGPCDACGSVVQRQGLFRSRWDEGRNLTLCGVCHEYVQSYETAERYAVVVLRAMAGYGTGLPTMGTPPRVVLWHESGRPASTIPWAHVDRDEVTRAADTWYTASQKDGRIEQQTLRGVVPHRWPTPDQSAMPQPLIIHGTPEPRCTACVRKPTGDDGLCDFHAGRDPMAEENQRKANHRAALEARREAEEARRLSPHGSAGLR